MSVWCQGNEQKKRRPLRLGYNFSRALNFWSPREKLVHAYKFFTFLTKLSGAIGLDHPLGWEVVMPSKLSIEHLCASHVASKLSPITAGHRYQHKVTVDKDLLETGDQCLKAISSSRQALPCPGGAKEMSRKKEGHYGSDTISQGR